MKKRITIFTIIFFAQACAIGPDFESPKLDIPSSWQEDTNNEQPKISDLTNWWQKLNAPALVDLINIALDKNLDLKIAIERISKAKAERRVAFAGLFPTLESDESYSRSRRSANAGSGPGGGTLDPGRFNSNSKYSNLFQGDLDFNWEIDISGGVRRAIESFDASIEFAEENARGVKLMLVSEVVINYFDLQSVRTELKVLEESLKAQNVLLEIAEARAKAGLVGDLDVLEAEAEKLSIESQIPLLKEEELRLSYRIDGLLGAAPGHYRKNYLAAAKISNCENLIPLILPAKIIEQRPDIRRSEAELHDKTARIGVTKAEYFPRISLGGSLGLRSSESGDFVNHDSLFWFFGPSVHIPIFSAGKIQAQVKVATAEQKAAIAEYEQTVLKALEEIEGAFVNLRETKTRNVTLKKAVKAYSRTADLSQKLYQAGIVDFSRVITANRQLYESQRALVLGERKELQALVFLYRALGGGWS